MTKVLDDDDIRTAALGYIFHRIEGMMDGKPMMLFIDEGWKILSDDKFSGFLNDKLKTIRKLNGDRWLRHAVGQGYRLVAHGPHAARADADQHFLPQSQRRMSSSYVDGFKLSEREFEWVINTHPDSRQFLVKHDQDSVIARLDLSDMLDIVKVLSGNVDTVQECEELRARVGDDPTRVGSDLLQLGSAKREVSHAA